MKNFYITFLICGLLYRQIVAHPVLVALDTIITVASGAVSVYKFTHKGPDIPELLRGMSNDLKNLLKNINAIGSGLSESLDAINVNIPEELQTAAQVNKDVEDIFKKAIHINYIYAMYLRYANGDITTSDLDTFIKKATSADGDSPEQSALHIYKMIMPAELSVTQTNFFGKLVHQLNTYQSQRCKKNQSPQQYMINLANYIATLETRAFLAVTAAHQLRSMTTNKNPTNTIVQKKDEFIERMRNFLKEVHEVVSRTSTEVSYCKSVYIEENKRRNLDGILLLPTETDYRNNMVVTQVRFVIHLGLLQLQIQEGKLIANGDILTGSERWIPLNNVVRDNPYTTDSYYVVKENEKKKSLIMNEEYRGFLWDYLRLKTEVVPRNNVVIGMEFKVVNAPVLSDQHCMFEIFVMYVRLKYAEVDFTTGKINANSVKYSDRLTSLPTGVTGMLQDLCMNLSSGNDDYVRLYTDDVYNKQLNQYVDSQAVHANPLLPVTGVGFFKTVDPIHGRSVSIKIETLDITEQVKTNVQ